MVNKLEQSEEKSRDGIRKGSSELKYNTRNVGLNKIGQCDNEAIDYWV